MSAFIRPDLQAFAAYSAHAITDVQTQPARVDHLDTNESSYDLPTPLKEKLAWEYQQVIQANRYPDGGHEELRAAIANYASQAIAETKLRVTANQVTVGNGSDELIRSLLIATCVGRSGSILVAEPTFSMYKVLAQTLGVDVVSVGRDAATFEMDLAAADTAIATATTPVRMVFMVSPNSPTGNGLTPAELDWLRNLPTDILVVVDEAYFEFSQASTLAEALNRPNWLITRTFSKAFRLAAHRVGYAIAPSEIIAILEKVRLPYNLPSFSQAAALIALRYAPDILTTVAEVQTERDRLWQALQSLPGLQTWPSAANFLYCRPTTQRLDDLFQQLYARGTQIRQTGGGLRITIGTPAENERTLANLHQALES
ncbi:histidinol-phosphate transaminase [Leptolyngbya iicbica]|uniref:Histidinol-phosphate aminotransferase n=2 Tax=Cyanophyceae TaxID=3028117 RepID=A0A4Q7E577_9CYAN|nr:histidinol-phosphate transaminase [Leptolyngbya sp. LK]RZM77388.1 histidinol-phosphate transaminase [Leptolyngbya sp. LK]